MFIARERELHALANRLNPILEGNFNVAFVIGEAGQGKTALLQAFAEQIQRQYASCVVGWGSCNAYTGVGDPYLPFREVLDSILQRPSDVHGHQWDGSSAWCVGMQAIATAGIDLLDTFVAARPLLAQLSHQPTLDAAWVAPFQAHLQALVSQPQQTVPQWTLFAQYARVLQAIARQCPLVIVLDDLQWVDAGSVDLLFYLGRQLQANDPRWWLNDAGTARSGGFFQSHRSLID